MPHPSAAAEGGDVRPYRPPICPELQIEPPAERIAAGLHDLAEAGADEAILVVDPITERSVRRLADVLADLDD